MSSSSSESKSSLRFRAYRREQYSVFRARLEAKLRAKKIDGQLRIHLLSTVPMNIQGLVLMLPLLDHRFRRSPIIKILMLLLRLLPQIFLSKRKLGGKLTKLHN